MSRRLPVGLGGVIRGAEGLRLDGGARAVLMLHGFGDTPQSLQALAEHLNQHEWTVSAPRLPGHGSTLREFSQARATDWLRAARAEYMSLCRSHRDVAVLGQSMGAALAVILAADIRDVPAVVLLAPYVRMSSRAALVARWHSTLAIPLPYLRTSSAKSIWNPEERQKSLGYGYVSPHGLAELQSITQLAWAAAPRVMAATLVVQSRTDNRVRAADVEQFFERLGAARKQLRWLTGRGHVIAVDSGRGEVFARTREWLSECVVERERPGAHS